MFDSKRLLFAVNIKYNNDAKENQPNKNRNVIVSCTYPGDEPWNANNARGYDARYSRTVEYDGRSVRRRRFSVWIVPTTKDCKSDNRKIDELFDSACVGGETVAGER